MPADGHSPKKVETLDVSRSGVHLCGLTVALKLEDTVSVSYKDQKARYLVKWLVPVPTVPGSPARWNAGLENRAPERNIFDFPLPTPIFDNYAGQSSSGLPGGSAAEPTDAPRMRCVASAELHPAGTTAPIMAGIADLSLGGCFVEYAHDASPFGTQLKAVVWLDAVSCKFQQSSATSRPWIRHGIAFQQPCHQRRMPS